MSEHIELARIPVRTIETFPFRHDIFEIIQTILSGHGATVERYTSKCVLTFPEGTYKFELFPRVRDSRYIVHFPDGYQLYETCLHTGTLSLVRLNLDEFPLEVQEQIQREEHL